MFWVSDFIVEQTRTGRRLAVRKSVGACCLVVLAACSAEPIEGVVSETNAVPLADSAVLNVRIVNSESAPLEGMVPIAFNGPALIADTVAEGAPTGADGAGQVSFPRDRWVYVRATDPAGHWVGTDYVESAPGEARAPDDPAVLTMGAPSSVTATLQRADGSALSKASVHLSMIHPAHGQWWQAESTADDSGIVRFDGLPPGVYALKLQLMDATTATIREAVLSGGEVKDLGVVSPQASE